MFDTMTFTKALGAICGSLLVFLLLGWAGSSLYTMGGGHGGEEVAQIQRGQHSFSVGNVCVCKDQVAGWERSDDLALLRIGSQVIFQTQIMHISQKFLFADVVTFF